MDRPLDEGVKIKVRREAGEELSLLDVTTRGQCGIAQLTPVFSTFPTKAKTFSNIGLRLKKKHKVLQFLVYFLFAYLFISENILKASTHKQLLAQRTSFIR